MNTAKRNRRRAGILCLTIVCAVIAVAALAGLHHHEHDACLSEHCAVCCLLRTMRCLLNELIPLLFLLLADVTAASAIRWTVSAQRPAPPTTLITLKIRQNP